MGNTCRWKVHLGLKELAPGVLETQDSNWGRGFLRAVIADAPGGPVARGGGGGRSIPMRKTCESLMTTRGGWDGKQKQDRQHGNCAHKAFRGLGSLRGQKGTRGDTESAPRVGTALKTGTRSSFVGRRRVAFHPSDKNPAGAVLARRPKQRIIKYELKRRKIFPHGSRCWTSATKGSGRAGFPDASLLLGVQTDSCPGPRPPAMLSAHSRLGRSSLSL